MLASKLRLLVSVLAVALASSATAHAETLSEALASAYKTSGLLEQNRAVLRAADEDVAQAVAGLRPVLNYLVSANYSTARDSLAGNDGFTAQYGLTAQMLLTDFGRSKLGLELAKENVLSLRDGLVGVEQNVLLQAVSAYMNVLGTSALVELQRSNERVLTQELKASRDRFEVGDITRTDVSLAEAALATARSAVASALGDMAVAREQYRAAVGHYPGQLRSPARVPATARSLAAATDIAHRSHPSILQSQRAVTIADLSVAMADAARKPRLTGTAQFGFDQDQNQDLSVGLNLSGPIYSGGAIASAYRQAAAQRDASRAALHLTQIGVDQNVGIAWSGLSVAQANITSTDEQVRAQTVAYRGVREEANLGARTTLDVLNAEQNLLNARTARVSAETNRYVAAYQLLAAMGLLTADHLRLGVTQYDPAAYYDAVKKAPSYKVSPQGEKLDRVLKGLGKN